VREDLAAVREDLAAVREDLAALVPVRKGHFSLESGHHGDTWLELARLCLHPGRVRRLAEQLGDRLVELRVEAVCGPLVEGAFVAFLVASHLGVPFIYADRQENRSGVRYRVPAALREALCGRRVASRLCKRERCA
jgi:orotate phosphoribosyltransferase